MWNAFAAVTLEPVTRFGYGLPFLFTLRLIIDGSVAESGGDGIDEGFQETDQGRELHVGQAVDQLVRMLASFVHREPPEMAPEKQRPPSFTE